MFLPKLTLGRLEQIAQILQIKMQDILSFDEKNVFNFINSPNSNGYINNLYANNNIEQVLKEIFTRLHHIEKKFQ